MKVGYKNTAKGVTVQFDLMTLGEALALCHALTKHAATSPITDDLRQILRNRVQCDGQGSSADTSLLDALTC